MIPRLTIDDRELLAVPAVHNLSLFAELVNRACRDEATRPQAVAVELSHDAVTAVVNWLKELGIGPGCAGKIPCMLGLAKTNRRIHPRFRIAAMHLQELHGLPLHRIPPEILRKEINFSSTALLCLTITDSMIEAIRSAMEFGLPVYGIDLGDVASGERCQPMLQDPLEARNDLAAYVERNGSHLESQRDSVVDERRECVMAARLKRLLQQYDRVLFTGGLGHWQQLCQRLCDPALAPATEPVFSEGEQFTRAVVAPSLAVYQMDMFPDFTVIYESIRQLPPEAKERLMDFQAVYRMKLATAWECAEPKNREATGAFVQYLTNLCLLHQRRLPDLFMTLNVARAVVSKSFASRLGEALVSRALDWARPEQWPELPYLEAPPGGDEWQLPDAGQRAQLRQGEKRSCTFYLSHMSERQNKIPELWQIPSDLFSGINGSKRQKHQGYCTWVWPPCETLLFGTAHAAAEIASRNMSHKIAEPFDGSLHHGLDVKATLRAITRGEHRVHVRVQSASVEANDEFNGEPSVLIFELPETVNDGCWGTFLAGETHRIREFVRNPARFDLLTREKGGDFVVSVHYYADREPMDALRPHVDSLRYLHGITLFGSPSLTPMHSARWLEARDYKACPVLRSASINCVFEHYRKDHQLLLDPMEWPVSLIRMALPFAKRRVVIVAPPHLVLPANVFREASARRLSLDILPFTNFPPDKIQEMRHQYLVCPRDLYALDYPEEMQKAFGNSPLRYLEMLPEHMRAELASTGE